MPPLPSPPTGRDALVAWVRTHLGHLTCDEVRPSAIRGGQAAADGALAALDLTGYAAGRSTVLPVGRRRATRLSPYIRHGLLPLPTIWAAAAGAPPRDRTRFRDELLWQEYARHLYARVGTATAEPLRFAPPRDTGPWEGEPWPDRMACMAATTAELHADGWLVNQTRMWLSSQWAVRAGRDWRDGEQEMYRHLLDGSRAANRLGWQWTVGTATGKPYGFSRWQVEKRAPQLCRGCALRDACPVQDWPAAHPGAPVPPPPGLTGSPRAATTAAPGDPGRHGAGAGGTGPGGAGAGGAGAGGAGAGGAGAAGTGAGGAGGGPRAAEVTGKPEAVWLTAESLGDTDPALRAHPDLPAVFVFDEPLLARLRLSGKRLVFLAETLAELGAEVRLGDPVTELRGRPLATTWTYVPGWRTRARQLDVVALHPWPWLRRPGTGSLRSYSAWAR